MLAELSVLPLDKGGQGLSRYVADSIKIIEESGLDYEVHALGTLIEGPADKVFEVIRKCSRQHEVSMRPRHDNGSYRRQERRDFRDKRQGYLGRKEDRPHAAKDVPTKGGKSYEFLKMRRGGAFAKSPSPDPTPKTPMIYVSFPSSCS